MNESILLYEDTPAYDSWLKYLLGGILALTFILGIVYIPQDIIGAAVMFAVTLFDALLFYVILPKRFLIYENQLVVKLGGPFAINIPLSDIEEAKPAPPRNAFFYGGIRFATSTGHIVEIVRRKGMNLLISPSHDDIFLEQLNQAQHASSNPE
ncbi:hypothetical protein ACFLW0_06565 [Chloroflexota bacterium]